ncbi:MAG: Eco57I restriction-modification methylase domain-containing protein [Planctomycetaceae bacterium]|nr:Eco57I restriction-modification methylase domain-containing protein [Planctomycetaceae bacterium]
MAKTSETGQINIKQALNKAFRKLRPTRAEIDTLKSNLTKLLNGVTPKESEEYHKNLLKDFLKDTAFSNCSINTKERIDLVIHNGKEPTSDVGIIIEVKAPSNKNEMPTTDNLNAKATQELLFYFLRERITHKNHDIKHLIITNLYEWFIFDAKKIDKLADDTKLKKHFKDFDEGRLTFVKTESFYKEIISPVLKEMNGKIEFVAFDIREYKKHIKEQTESGDKKLIELQKILSSTHLLTERFINDSNTLNEKFYSELLHIIGLEEYPEGGKKLIKRQSERNRDEDSLIEAAITQISSLDKLTQIKNPEQYGKNTEDRLFNIALELAITWINRILFLKLLESQIVSYHQNNKEYLFLNKEKVKGYDDLNDLFFQVLAVEVKNRRKVIHEKFPKVPYLNSSLFEPTELELQTVVISNLPDNTNITLYKKSVVNGGVQKLTTLEYLFKFLDAYDFSSEGREEVVEENKALITASVLGLIFEKINGYKDGSFFTPGFITMYMCREVIRRAVVQKFKEQTDFKSDEFGDLINYTSRAYKQTDIDKYNGIINSLKICDPAVGSGHFLVSALNEIIAVKSDLGILCDKNGKPIRDYLVDVENDELLILDRHNEFFKYDPENRETQTIQKTLFQEKQTIIENCLFGVDINPNSVKICRLRLWIELLKNAYYKEDGELETLPNIDINIKCGNSLVSFLPINSDIRTIFDGDVNLQRYKDSVVLYKHAEDKSTRDKMRAFINNTKEKFRARALYASANTKMLKKLEKEYSILVAPQFFSETEDEKKEKAKKLALKKVQIDKLKGEIEKNIIEKENENALEWRYEFPELLDEKTSNFTGFDIIIGNPPYIKENDDKTIFDGLRDLEVYKGKMDIWYLFCGLGLDLLKDNAYICFIATNNWTTNYGAKKLRNKIVRDSKIIQLIDFNDFMVFDEASIQTMILLLKKDKTADKYNFDYRKIIETSDNFKPTDILNKNKNNPNIMLVSPLFNRDDMIEQTFTFSEKKDDNILKKIKANSNYILSKKELINGIHSHHDKVTKKMLNNLGKGTKIGQGIFALKIEELKSLGLIKKEQEDLIRPYYTSKQLHKYWANRENEEWIIYTTSEFKNIKNIKPYPNIQNHLDKFMSVITSDNKPYGLHRARDEEFFNGEKIIAVRKSPHEPVFTYTDFPCYVSAAFYSIKTDKVNMKYLTALLNSKLIKFWLDHKGKKQGNNFQVDAEPLTQIPLMKISGNEQEPFIALVDEILAMKNKDPKANTSGLEKQIDEMVYKLYGLTDDEIKIVKSEK